MPKSVPDQRQESPADSPLRAVARAHRTRGRAAARRPLSSLHDPIEGQDVLFPELSAPAQDGAQ
jgi:hypothetical protein